MILPLSLALLHRPGAPRCTERRQGYVQLRRCLRGYLVTASDRGWIWYPRTGRDRAIAHLETTLAERTEVGDWIRSRVETRRSLRLGWLPSYSRAS